MDQRNSKMIKLLRFALDLFTPEPPHNGDSDNDARSEVDDQALLESARYEHGLLREDLRHLRDDYLKERQVLLQLKNASIHSFDKAMLTLSASALAFSISMLGILEKPLMRTEFLHGSWLLFAAAVLSTVVSLFLSHQAFHRELKRVDLNYRSNTNACLTNYGIGVDRLIMVLGNGANLREVILFPHLRPGSPE